MRFQDHKQLNRGDINDLYFKARFLFRNSEMVNDIVGDAIMNAYQSNIEFNSKDHFHIHLFQSMKNMAIDFIKKQQQYEEDKALMVHDYNRIEDGIESKLIERETIKQIYSAIDDLPGKVGTVAKLLFLNDLSIKEVADLLDLSLRSVIRYKKHALIILKERINRDTRKDNQRNISKEKPHKLCLRVRNGKIEVVMEQSDGTWILSDGKMELVNGLYVFQQSGWAVLCFSAFGSTFFSKILELKLPSERISLACRNGHSDYSKKLIKAINQLRDYHQAFDSDRTKQKFKDKYRTEVFKPDLQLVFGRRDSINNDKAFLELQRRNNVIITDWDSLYEKLKKKYS